MTKPQTRLVDSPSGLSSLTQYCLPGGASRLAALLLPQILAVFSVVAPCHPGAALRNPVLLQRGQATSQVSDAIVPVASRWNSIRDSTDVGTAAPGPAKGRSANREIGRASCREADT